MAQSAEDLMELIARWIDPQSDESGSGVFDGFS
jgi:hypothetical protein